MGKGKQARVSYGEKTVSERKRFRGEPEKVVGLL
jgi:hypothetical protein